MSEPPKFGKFLRIVGLILLSLTAIFHLMGGIGTTCVALGAEKYDSMAGIIPFKWLYQLFVVITIAIAVYAIRATIRFARSKPQAYRDVLIILVIGLVVSLGHMIASRLLRGSSMPNDARVYMNALTLVVFLLFGIKKLRQAIGIDSNAPTSAGKGGLGAAFVVMGVTTLSIHLFAGPTHTWNGINYADVWHTQLQLAGWGMVVAGAAITLASVFRPQLSPKAQPALEVGGD